MPNKRPTKTRGSKEAEATLQAIRQGSVDAFVVEEPEGHRVYTLEGADLPYSVLVERMQQGAAMIDAQGAILYCNPGLGELMGVPNSDLIGTPFQQLLDPADMDACQQLFLHSQNEPCGGEMNLRRPDGTAVPAHFSFRQLSRDKSATGVLITDLTAQKQHNELASRLQRLQDEERRRIARDLHDSVGQLLVAIAMNTSSIKKEAHKLTPEVACLVDENALMVDDIGKEIRTISHLLHPPLLDEVGLASAIRWYLDGFAQRSNIEANLDIPDNLARLPQEMEIALFRVVQECLTNIHRHSGSSSCGVKIVQDDKAVQVQVTDSGRGIPQEKQSILQSSGGVGLRGLQERIRLLGGAVDIKSSEQGTTVTARLPLSGRRTEQNRENVA
jgi:PAS domain S-box-containing protein